jgi:predicted RecA/RadA family phage recombinase
MKNFVQPGKYGMTVIAPAGGAVSGQIVHIGAIIGVAACTVAAGAEVEIATEGVFDLPKIVADVHAAGDVAKVDAAGNVDLAGTTVIGWIVLAAAAGSTTARVKLCPGIGGAGATLFGAAGVDQPIAGVGGGHKPPDPAKPPVQHVGR